MVRKLSFLNRHINTVKRSQKRSATRYRKRKSLRVAALGVEWLEDRAMLSADPVLSVVGTQTVDENAALSITDLGTFTDVVEGVGGGSSVGLNPADFTALGAFDPSTNVTINTDTLAISGGFTGTGTFVTENAGFANYQIAVFTFTNFELDSSLSITVTGSRPVALLSLGDLTVAGVIDVSAVGMTPGAGGGRGGWSDTGVYGVAAPGADPNSRGTVGSAGPLGGGSGSGGGFGGVGGHGEVFGSPNGNGLGGAPLGGVAYGNPLTSILGGGGGSAANRNVLFLAPGGGGGGGIELGAALDVEITGSVLANGGHGTSNSAATGGGGGAGGGILIHGNDVDQFGTLSATGGNGGTGIHVGGGGGGGNIRIVHSGVFDRVDEVLSVTGTEIVLGGTSSSTVAADGGNGIAEVVADAGAPTPVIESFDFVIDWGDGSPNSTGAAMIDVPGAEIDDIVEGSFDGSHTYADDGPYTVTVTINDNNGGTDTESFTVMVNNVDPTLSVDNAAVTVNEGQPAANSGTFGDVPADTVTVAASIGSVTFGGGVWNWTFNSTDDLEQLVTITATDEDGGQSQVTFDLTVDNVDPTLAVNNAAVVVNEGQAAANSGSYGDVPADTVSLVASLGTVVGNAGVWNWSYTPPDNAALQSVTITATDGDGGSTVVTFDFTVNNVAPTASAGGPYATVDDTPITLAGSGTDVAGAADPLTFSWDLDGDNVFGETGTGATRGNEVGANPVFNPTGINGLHTVTVQVSDGDGGITSATAQIDVATVGTTLINGTLFVVGSNATSGTTDLAIISQVGGNIQANSTFNQSNPVSVPAAAVNRIEVRMRSGNDIFIVVPGISIPMTIDGGDGNDLLSGGGGDDLLIGGPGNDVLYGDSGNDVLVGGDGRDDLFGGAGNDVMIGGSGNDILFGGSGRDLIIGAQDNDAMDGGSDDDILIGGNTLYDEYDSGDAANIDNIMDTWTSADSFTARVADLTGTGGLLQAGVSVFDDDDNDIIFGGADRDLIFGDNDPLDGAVDMVSLQLLADVLVAVT